MTLRDEYRIHEQSFTLADIAARYQPILYLHKALDYMRPDQILYEAINENGLLYINYYVQWRDEIALNKLWHAIYSRIRKVRYGSVTDIEFVEVGVMKATGRVASLAFEWDPNQRPDVPVPLHYMVVAKRRGGGNKFDVTVREKPAAPFEIKFEADRPTIFVPVWNHIYDFYRGEGVRLADPPLEPMTEALYNKYWMGKRSRPPSRIRALQKCN